MAAPIELSSIAVTAEQLGELLGITPRHVNRLVGHLKVARGRWTLGMALPALVEAISGGPAGGDLTKERTRLVKAQADRAELEYALARKEVAPLSEMTRAMDLRCGMIRARMMAIPARTLTMLIGEKDEARFRAVMTAEVKLALTEAAAEELTPQMLDDVEEIEAEEDTE